MFLKNGPETDRAELSLWKHSDDGEWGEQGGALLTRHGNPSSEPQWSRLQRCTKGSSHVPSQGGRLWRTGPREPPHSPAHSELSQAAARLQQRRRKVREQVTVGRARHQASLTSLGSCLGQATPLAALSGPCLPCPSTRPSSASCPLSPADPTAPHTPPGQRIEMAVAAVHLLPTTCHHVPAFTHVTSLHPYTSPSQQASLRLSFIWRSRPSEVNNLARSHPGNDGPRMGTHSPGRSLTSGHL